MINIIGTDGSVTPFLAGPGDVDEMALDSSKNLYVSDNGSNVIYKITPGGILTTFASGFNDAEGLVFDSSGNLFVANGPSEIDKITPGGTVSTFVTIASGGGFQDLKIDSGGNLYLASTGDQAIYKITPGGAVSTFASGLNFPTGLVFDSSGNLYVYDSGTIDKITPGGVVTPFVSGFTVNNVYDLTIDAAGDIYAPDTGGIIWEITPGGVATEFSDPGDIAENLIYVPEPGTLVLVPGGLGLLIFIRRRLMA